jgi:predicted CXXCH cytochrome family protein
LVRAWKKYQSKVFIVMGVLGLFLISPSFSWAGIANTKHNLSAGGPHAAGQTIYAKPAVEQLGLSPETAEGVEEVCIFCHIPHNALPAVPLWNHTVSSSAYTMYKSDYLSRSGYDIPTELGVSPSSPGYRSRLCLSCHDGTVAIGGIYIMKGEILTSPIEMMSGVTTMPSGTGNIGTNLTNDHPVAIKYENKTINFGSGSRTMELNAVAPAINPKPYIGVKLYDGTGVGGSVKGYVECTSCHDPHTESPKFLVRNDSNLAESIKNICSACHDKTGWGTLGAGVHKSPPSSLFYTDSSVQTYFGTNSMDTLGCMNCHKTHGGSGIPYILKWNEETTCFQGAAGSSSGAPCHGSSPATGGKNIESFISSSLQSRHPATYYSGIHTNLDVLAPSGDSGVPSGYYPSAGKGLNWNSYKHAECADCHNPHQTQQGTHVDYPGAANSGRYQWYPSIIDANSNLTSRSGALTGVTGIEVPTFFSAWTVPTTFTTIESASKEYQICFKCHSYYALQDPDGITSYTTASGATVTDQAKEFNPENKSAHPVVESLGLRALIIMNYGSVSINPLYPPWDSHLGNQTMYCSDCHGADSEASTDPKGPHGSNSKYMLKGQRKYWPKKSNGAFWALGDLYYQDDFASGGGLFCKNCHPIWEQYQGYNGWSNNVHTQGSTQGYNYGHQNTPCVSCHVAVPHGSKRSRLIGYVTDPAPYNYNPGGPGNLMVTGFKKASGPWGYDPTRAIQYCDAAGCGYHPNGGVTNPEP